MPSIARQMKLLLAFVRLLWRSCGGLCSFRQRFTSAHNGRGEAPTFLPKFSVGEQLKVLLGQWKCSQHLFGFQLMELKDVLFVSPRCPSVSEVQATRSSITSSDVLATTSNITYGSSTLTELILILRVDHSNKGDNVHHIVRQSSLVTLGVFARPPHDCFDNVHDLSRS